MCAPGKSLDKKISNKKSCIFAQILRQIFPQNIKENLPNICIKPLKRYTLPKVKIELGGLPCKGAFLQTIQGKRGRTYVLIFEKCKNMPFPKFNLFQYRVKFEDQNDRGLNLPPNLPQYTQGSTNFFLKFHAFLEPKGIPNKDSSTKNSKLHIDFYFINWWFKGMFTQG